MGREENLIIFEKLTKFIGLALQTARVASRKTKTELAQLLRQTPNFAFTNSTLVKEIEDGKCELSFENFEIICSTLGFSTEKVLKCASDLRRCGGEHKKEYITQEALREIGYQIWKTQQSNDHR